MTFGVLAKRPFFTGRDNPITFLHFSKQEPYFRLCINMSTVTRLKQPVDVNCSVKKWAVVVARLAKHPLPIPEICSSNPTISKLF